MTPVKRKLLATPLKSEAGVWIVEDDEIPVKRKLLAKPMESQAGVWIVENDDAQIEAMYSDEDE